MKVPRSSTSSLVVVALLGVAPAGGQTPAATSSPAPPQSLAGHWKGSAKLSPEVSQGCTYQSSEADAPVSLELEQVGGTWTGRLRLDLPASGQGCPALGTQTYPLSELTVSATELRFQAPPGQAWNLARREDALLGLASRAPGAAPPPFPLVGELRLHRIAAADSPGRAPRQTRIGAGAVAAFLTANAVAAAALVLVNQADDKQDTGGQITCSPRSCQVIAGAGCQCNDTRTFGGECGTTPAGVAFAQPCDLEQGRPCEAGLTCTRQPDGNQWCEEGTGSCGI